MVVRLVITVGDEVQGVIVIFVGVDVKCTGCVGLGIGFDVSQLLDLMIMIAV